MPPSNALVSMTVGPVSAASARTWAAASRRTLVTVRARPDLDVPDDVVDAFEAYLDLWAPAMDADVFEWTGSVDPAQLRHLAAHWARLVNLARDDSETDIAPADPEGQAFYDALAEGFAAALAAADETSPEPFAAKFEEVVPDFVGARSSLMSLAGRMRVLLVDDHPDIRLLVRIGLEADGRFEIVGEATDGQEAIDAMCPGSEGGCPDAVLLDLAMPVMDGLEALPHLLERCPKVRVIVFSANDEPANRRQAEALGAAGFLPKGATIAAIAGALLQR
jgi:CheY-like chemotaxis protein